MLIYFMKKEIISSSLQPDLFLQVCLAQVALVYLV